MVLLRTWLGLPATDPSFEQIFVDHLGVVFKFRYSTLREKMDAVVKNFLLRRISAPIFGKEAVGKIVPYVVDSMNCASNVITHPQLLNADFGACAGLKPGC